MRENGQADKKEQVVKVTKVINYDKCSQRPEFSQNTFYGQRCEECQQVREMSMHAARVDFKKELTWKSYILISIHQA